MQVTNKIAIDMVRGGNTQAIRAMQGDANTRQIAISLFENSVPWIIPDGASASIAFENLKDGHGGWYDKLPDGTDALSVDGNSVTAILAPAVLSSDGDVRVSVVFQDENLNQIATFGFSVVVEESPAAQKSIANDYYEYSTLEEINEGIRAALLGTPNAIISESLGETISVKDASNSPFKGLILYGKTTQDGTPTPDAPIDLVSAGDDGNVGVNVYGKNYALTSSVNKPINMGAGSLLVSAKQLEAPLKAGHTYTLTADISCDNPDKVYLMQDSSFKTLGYFRNDGRQSLTFTVGDSDYVGLYFYGGKDLTTSKLYAATFENITVCEGEPQTLTVSTPNGLPGVPVSTGGNYTDASGQQWITDEIDFARGVYVNHLTYLEFDGSNDEDWKQIALVSEYDSVGGFQVPLTQGTNNIYLCNKYSVIAPNHVMRGDEGICVREDGADTVVTVCDYTQDGASVSEWKTALANDPIVCVCKLVSPVETALPSETLDAYARLHTNKPNTTVYTDSNVGIKMEYVADTKTYIDNKFAELAAAIVANP